MGRPKLNNVRLQVRFTPDQIEAIDALAKLLRETRNGVIQRSRITSSISKRRNHELHLSTLEVGSQQPGIRLCLDRVCGRVCFRTDLCAASGRLRLEHQSPAKDGRICRNGCPLGAAAFVHPSTWPTAREVNSLRGE
jgi:hypothetical protein